MKSRGPFIAHLLFWLLIGLVLFLEIMNFKGERTIFNLAVNYGYSALANISIFYINYTLLIPLLVKEKKKYGLYVVAIVIVIVLMSLIKMALASLHTTTLFSYIADAGKGSFINILKYVVSTVFVSGFFIVASSLLKFAVDWFGNESVQRNLVMEKKEMELQFLKSQLNPHFLFNSLNNIYSLAYQKSDKTADAILKLSEIMRYMIYESNDSWVSLSKEIEYVQSFIELQKLRFKDGANVELTLNGEIDDQQIVPLILISFVENAFKHGVANDPKNPIKINIIANQKILHFSVTNKKNKYNKDEMGGVGLNNVERRLQLLYPDRYKLNIVNSATHYTTELMLDI